jgi:hypothetical protein
MKLDQMMTRILTVIYANSHFHQAITITNI